jgi:Flp pilus assembly protein TadG
MKWVSITGNAAIRRRRPNDRSGAEVLEAALVLFFVLMPLILGMVEYGLLFHLTHTLQGAAREGARARVVLGVNDNTSALAAVNNVLTNVQIDTTKITTAINPLSGGYYEVTVAARWGDLGMVLLPPPLGPDANHQIVGRAVMKKEPDPTAP